MCVPSGKSRFPVDWIPLVKGTLTNIGIPLNFFWVLDYLVILCVLNIFVGYGSVRTNLLCIMGEIAGGGSFAGAVAFSDR